MRSQMDDKAACFVQSYFLILLGTKFLQLYESDWWRQGVGVFLQGNPWDDSFFPTTPPNKKNHINDYRRRPQKGRLER